MPERDPGLWSGRTREPPHCSRPTSYAGFTASTSLRARPRPAALGDIRQALLITVTRAGSPQAFGTGAQESPGLRLSPRGRAGGRKEVPSEHTGVQEPGAQLGASPSVRLSRIRLFVVREPPPRFSLFLRSHAGIAQTAQAGDKGPRPCSPDPALPGAQGVAVSTMRACVWGPGLRLMSPHCDCEGPDAGTVSLFALHLFSELSTVLGTQSALNND